MAATPSRPPQGVRTADLTRPLEASSPTNFNRQRTAKRQQRGLNVAPPPVLALGGRASAPTVSAAFRGQLEAAEREAQTEKDVYGAFADQVDKFVAGFADAKRRSIAQKLGDRVLSVLTAGLQPNHAASAPIITPSTAPRGANSANAPGNTASSNKPLSWAAVAGMGTQKILRISGARSAGSAKTSSRGSTASPTDRPDPRILVRLDAHHILHRADSYALRMEIVKRLEGLITMEAIPAIKPTRTGWAIHCSDVATRDRLIQTQASYEWIHRLTQAQEISVPTNWYNYVVPGLPSTVPRLQGDPIPITAQLVKEEFSIQTKTTAINAHPSRHGTNARTGLTTWVVASATPVPPFTLFGRGLQGRLKNHKSVIRRHNPGCQGYCIPARCLKQARCERCSVRLVEHVGPAGLNCAARPRCANCYGPFPADHLNCPAAPRRVRGQVVCLSTKQLSDVRTHGWRVYGAETAKLNKASQKAAPAPTTNPARKRPAAEDTPEMLDTASAPAATAPISTPEEQDFRITPPCTASVEPTGDAGELGDAPPIAPTQPGPGRVAKKGARVTQYENAGSARQNTRPRRGQSAAASLNEKALRQQAWTEAAERQAAALRDRQATPSSQATIQVPCSNPPAADQALQREVAPDKLNPQTNVEC